MTNFKDEWDTEMALEVLRNKTVDSKLWGEAAKWLFLFGPPAIREMLGQASSLATSAQFPGLLPVGYSEFGEPLYDIDQLASTLGLSKEEIIADLSLEEQDPARATPPGMAFWQIQ